MKAASAKASASNVMRALRALLEGLGPVWLNAQIAYHEWALREMHPLHPDLPFVMQTLSALRDRRAAL
jgi:hypothetical protein